MQVMKHGKVERMTMRKRTLRGAGVGRWKEHYCFVKTEDTSSLSLDIDH